MKKRSAIALFTVVIIGLVLYLAHWSIRQVESARKYASDQQRVSALLDEADALFLKNKFDDELELLVLAEQIARKWSAEHDHFARIESRIQEKTVRSNESKRLEVERAFGMPVWPDESYGPVDYVLVRKGFVQDEYVVRIKISPGRNPDQVVETMKAAGRDAVIESDGMPIVVFAYRLYDSGVGHYTAGTANINFRGVHPNFGSGFPVFSYELGDLYFQEFPLAGYPVGSEWVVGGSSDSVFLGIRSESWDSSSLVGPVISNSVVRIVDARFYTINEREDIIRIFVEVIFVPSGGSVFRNSHRFSGGSRSPVKVGSRGWLHPEDLLPK